MPPDALQQLGYSRELRFDQRSAWVDRCHWQSTKGVYISPLFVLRSDEKNNALNEVRILASIENRNIIAYKEAFFDEQSSSLCIVMEFADGGDLYNKILMYKKQQ